MIVCFSGTGNSRLVALELQKYLKGEILMLEGELLRNPSSRRIELPDGEDVVWVFPIYSWGVSPVVANFIRRSKFLGADKARHFMVCTCGDDIGNADEQWRRLIGHRIWAPWMSFSVQMPNTYVCMKGFDTDAPDVEKAKLADMPSRVAEIAKILLGHPGKGSDVVRGSWSWVKTEIIYPYFTRFCMSPKPFRSTSRCISCGLCARTCPMENIEMKSGRPVWGNNCALCLRCYHHCPVQAIEYGEKTEGKGHYTAAAAAIGDADKPE